VFAASNLGLEVVGEACDSTTCAPIRFEGGSPIVLQQPKGPFFWRRGRATDVTPDGASTFGEYEVLGSTLDPFAIVFRADAGGITTLASGLFATIVSPVRVTPDAACVVWTWNTMFGVVSSSIGSCGALPADRVEDVAADNAVGVGQIGLVAAQGSTTLGDLAGGSEESRALGVSDDGGIIVGWGTSASGREAVVWRDGGPIELLADVLTAEGVDVSNWTLEEATGVSASGRTIVGWGTNPNGDTEGFVATLGDGPAPTPPVPTLSPAGLLVFAAGLLGFIGYYRRRF
jgi:hypothetical protein